MAIEPTPSNHGGSGYVSYKRYEGYSGYTGHSGFSGYTGHLDYITPHIETPVKRNWKKAKWSDSLTKIFSREHKERSKFSLHQEEQRRIKQNLVYTT